ncbi:MAG: cupin domain-containing protein [Gammaproteobacteria bacterium]|nr:cupin domain-containing protein [Gammaproteobacteria bacterium]
MWQLKNLDIDDFLSQYWQSRPLLIKQAFPGFQTVLSPEELAGLACEEGVHSRLVQEKGGPTPWHLRYGPFSEDDFTNLPESHYSLLVSECEKWIPELCALVECFNFIPRWRIDDLMISYAPEGGSVGPHTDEYDVFLLQANGVREWSIQHQLTDTSLIPDLDLAILQEFEADETWLLEPGDVLYLPPRVAHHGIARGNGCMTYSIGFRAPAISDIMDSFLLEASDHQLTDERYYDLPLKRGRDPAEITHADILHFKSLIYQTLDKSSALWPNIVGKLVSDTTLSEDVETIACDDIDTIARYLWQKHPDAKLFYHHVNNQLLLFCNGQSRTLEASDVNLDFCKMLCNQMILPLADIISILPSHTQQLVLDLIQQRTLLPILDDE